MPLDPIPLPLGGFDDREALLIDGKRSPNLQNIRLRRERITKRPGIARVEPQGARVATMAGFDQLGTTQPVVQLLSFPRTSGVGGTGLAKYDFDTQLWSPIPMPPSGDGPLNDFQHWSVVNTLNVVVWAASHHRLLVYAPVANAINPPLPGIADVLATDLPFKLGAMILIAFANRVIAVRVDEDDVLFPTRVRWCANGQINKWNPNTDGAGFLDVRETTNHPLTGAFVLNGRAYLTKAREMIAFEATGDSTKPFVARPLIQGRGMVAPHSVATSDYVAYFLGADNVYAWDGSSLTPIGDPIWETLSASIFFDEPDVGRLQRIVGAFYKRRNEYWLYVPDQLTKLHGEIVSVTQQRVFIYDAQADRWTIDVFEPPLAPQWFLPVLPLDVWATQPALSVMPREQMTLATDNDFRWFGDGDEFRDAVNPPTRFDVTGFANGGPAPHIPIDAFIETKDYEPQEFYRGQSAATLQKLNSLYEVRFQGAPGERVEVWMSPDQGRNWIKEEVVVNEYGVGVAYFLDTFSTLRLRFRALSTAAFDLHGMVQLKWQPAGWNPSLA